MARNPSKQGEPLSAPTNSRKNSTNDPGFENRQGYYPYDLSHTEVLTPLYGMVTPSMHLITYMGDHHVVKDETKTILNRINGNFLNTVNQYIDSFFVSNRTMFPNNWDKLIPNPIKGDDLPNSARPVVPLYAYFREFVKGQREFTINLGPSRSYTARLSGIPTVVSAIQQRLVNTEEGETFALTDQSSAFLSCTLANLTFLCSIISRGQLLDYLGVQFDFATTKDYETSLQYYIDDFFDKYYTFVYEKKVSLADIELSMTTDTITVPVVILGNIVTTPSQFRDRYMSSVESGELLWPKLLGYKEVIGEIPSPLLPLLESLQTLISALNALFGNFTAKSLADVDVDAEFNKDGSCINLSKCLAYQLSIAQYYTNNTVDNIFSSDLYMQLLRGVMFPSVDGYTSEPTFDYNGVPTEYDYISYGGFYSSIFGTRVAGWYGRMIVLGSLLFTLRRSLRYGDKFTTGRTQMLAVGQLSIPVETDEQTGSMSVNPVNVNIQILTQRYLNAANRTGNKPLDYYAGIMGVVPSDLPSIPRYVGHRKIELENRITTNTAGEQGAQTTNLVGYSDDMAFDVFIDDYGVLLSLNSYDVLPIYTSGIDSENFLSDRFEYMNPMMQNIGDEAIRVTELIGSPDLYDTNFAYVVRNSEYKYKLSKAHGAFGTNDLKGFLLKFPLELFDTERAYSRRIDHIGPDFIRDKPAILDTVISSTTGISPGRYFHFIVSVHNSVKSARLIQKAPGILF